MLWNVTCVNDNNLTYTCHVSNTRYKMSRDFNVTWSNGSSINYSATQQQLHKNQITWLDDAYELSWLAFWICAQNPHGHTFSSQHLSRLPVLSTYSDWPCERAPGGGRCGSSRGSCWADGRTDGNSVAGIVTLVTVKMTCGCETTGCTVSQEELWSDAQLQQGKKFS